MRKKKLFNKNNNSVTDNIVETSNNQLHKVDRLLFAYVNRERPDNDNLSMRITDREYEILQRP